MKKPDSLMNTRAAFSRATFFYPRPFLLDPTADLVLVAFHGAALGFLGTPSQSMQETTDMVDVVAQPEAVENELSHAGAGPQVGGKPSRLGPFEQSLFQATLVFLIQPRGTAGGGPGFDGLTATFPEGGVPTSYAPSVTTDHTCDFNRRMALLQQFDGAVTTTFEILWASGRPHRTPPAHSIGHSLYRSQ
jgi:hypothetical protein